jgi:hypothetical protein
MEAVIYYRLTRRGRAVQRLWFKTIGVLLGIGAINSVVQCMNAPSPPRSTRYTPLAVDYSVPPSPLFPNPFRKENPPSPRPKPAATEPSIAARSEQASYQERWHESPRPTLRTYSLQTYSVETHGSETHGLETHALETHSLPTHTRSTTVRETPPPRQAKPRESSAKATHSVEAKPKSTSPRNPPSDDSHSSSSDRKRDSSH